MLGPARQGLRTVSGPEGSSTKESSLGAVGSPGMSALATTFPFIRTATDAMPVDPNAYEPAEHERYRPLIEQHPNLDDTQTNVPVINGIDEDT